MKKPLIYLIISFVLFSCNNLKKNDLELFLINNEVVCVENIDIDVFKINEKNYHNDKIYDSLSLNIINYKLTNNSDKKYFISLNEDKLDVFENDYYMNSSFTNRLGKSNGISLNLYKNDSILNGKITLTKGGANYKNEIEYYKSPLFLENSIDLIFLEKIKKKKLYNAAFQSVIYRSYLENSFVIYPGDTKYFTSIVNLLFRKESVYWVSNIHEMKPDYAAITFVNIAKVVEENLSINQLKEIKVNGYTLFDGEIKSNKVPVKFVKM